MNYLHKIYPSLLPLCIVLLAGCTKTGTVDIGDEGTNLPEFAKTVDRPGIFEIVLGETVFMRR